MGADARTDSDKLTEFLRKLGVAEADKCVQMMGSNGIHKIDDLKMLDEELLTTLIETLEADGVKLGDPSKIKHALERDSVPTERELETGPTQDSRMDSDQLIEFLQEAGVAEPSKCVQMMNSNGIHTIEDLKRLDEE